MRASEHPALSLVAAPVRGWRLGARLRRSENLRTYVPLLVAIIGLGAYASLRSSLFLTGDNLRVLLESVSVLGLITVGMTLLLVAGQLDLSVGASAALGAVIGARLIDGGHSNGIAIPAIILFPALVSLAIGLVVVRTGVQPFILTLGLLSVLQSVSLIQTGQRPVPVGDRLSELDTATLLGVPFPFLLFVAALVAGSVILHFSALGRSAFAVGSNRDAAFLTGLRVGRVTIIVFVLSGLLVGLAALVLLSSIGAGDAGSGTGLELDAIAAAVIGGASLAGGKGSMFGSFLGVLLLGLIGNALTLLDVSSFYQQLVLGGLLMLAVTATAVSEQRRQGRGSGFSWLRRTPAPEAVPGAQTTSTGSPP